MSTDSSVARATGERREDLCYSSGHPIETDERKVVATQRKCSDRSLSSGQPRAAHRSDIVKANGVIAMQIGPNPIVAAVSAEFEDHLMTPQIEDCVKRRSRDQGSSPRDFYLVRETADIRDMEVAA